MLTSYDSVSKKDCLFMAQLSTAVFTRTQVPIAMGGGGGGGGEI